MTIAERSSYRSNNTNFVLLTLIILMFFALLILLYRNHYDKNPDDDINVSVEDIYNTENIRNLRNMIDTVDLNILKNIHKRSLIVKRIWEIKKQRGISIYDEDREQIILNRINKYAKSLNLNEQKVNKIYNNIIGGHFHNN